MKTSYRNPLKPSLLQLPKIKSLSELVSSDMSRRPEEERDFALPGYNLKKPGVSLANISSILSGVGGNSFDEMVRKRMSKTGAGPESFDDLDLPGIQPTGSRPSRDWDIDPSSVRPGSGADRITSYGYANDETPDSNSSAGIGAFVSEAEAAAIKRGEMTSNRLREGDIAISPDVEKRFRAEGVKPKSMISVKLDDGTVHTGRWMDRTASEYGGKKLTGRFDIYSPRGRSPMNDRQVVGWSRSTPKKPKNADEESKRLADEQVRLVEENVRQAIEEDKKS